MASLLKHKRLGKYFCVHHTAKVQMPLEQWFSIGGLWLLFGKLVPKKYLSYIHTISKIRAMKY